MLTEENPVRHPRATAGTIGAPASSGEVSLSRHAVLRDGRPWFPVMGEYHFSRDVPQRWAHELRQMRAGGIDVVATYLIWIVHEEVRGQRSWSGHRDVRAFVQAAHDAGLQVMLRVGPWAHGEARNGGFPDWLQQLDVRHRTNDPAYLELVESWYTDVARQLTGLFRDAEHPDAPIVGIQVDNELYDQPDHLATLRDMAEAAGMRAPLWVATGWGGAQLPLERLVPVYAGYSDAFWEESDVDWPDFGPMHFRFSDVRDDLSVGADLRGDAVVGVGADDGRYPFITCELGGGMAVAYHRRPLVDPEDVAALGLTKIGSGSAWQGYYLYHGTVQVTGELSGTQESHETGYPNDVPTKDYDFYAPLGAAGRPRRHYHLLRRQHLFLQRWGGDLAHMPPQLHPQDELRWSVRADGTRGYVFVNNHQPAVRPLPERTDVQLRVELAAGEVVLPSSPVTLRSGASFVWPLRQRYGDVTALSGTVQPITEIETGDGLLVVLAATPGIDVELEIESDAEVGGARRVSTPHGPRWVPTAEPGPSCVVTVGSTRLVVLDDGTADALWAGVVGGEETVLIWRGGLTFEGEQVLLERWEDGDEVLSIPALAGAQDRVGPFSRVVLEPATPALELAPRQVRAATGAAPTRRGGSADRLSAPREEDFALAAVIEVDVPSAALEPGANVLELDWRGDVARAFVGDHLVSDQFWYGRPWEIDLGPWRAALEGAPLRIEVLPWNGQADYFLDARVRAERTAGVAHVNRVSLARAQRTRLRTAAS